MKFVFGKFIILFALAGVISPSLSSGAPLDFSRLSLTAGCRIHRIDGRYLREFAGNLCLFLNDGRYITADSERIVMYAPDKSAIWKIPGHYHHQLNFSVDGKSILALASKFVPIAGESVRIDVLRRIDLNGKVTGEIGSDLIFEKLKINRPRSPVNWDQALKNRAELEISHFNSFHEIPPLDHKSKNPNIVAGNYIATSTTSGSVLIDKDLKVPLEKITYPTSDQQLIHDVQVMNNGQILLLNNEQVRDLANTGPRSAVEFFDPVSRRTTYSFQPSPAEMFYTPFSGGVQQLGDGMILISHVSNAFFFLDSKKKKIVRSDVLKNEYWVPNLIPVQEVRAQDLTEFLKKW